jgi:hypothetical protein
VTPVPPGHWVDGPPPRCAEPDCGRGATHRYLDAATDSWRYGCERHMRQRRADPERVAYVQLRKPGRRGTTPPTDGPGPP